ncbi:MAG: NAD(P)H-dependent oxidoreductase subunit E [Acidobacteria bacterium]|nr:NAD(P)H-dependent oxidoreductase subunit E [Acidobacteriota bacterium]MBI3662424.1 NAD(P)H-dependent oxidoreductase subunit E [Acidobacteriota bacterium]
MSVAPTTYVSMTDFEPVQLEALLADFEETRESLIPLLQEVQTQYCYLPEFALRRIASKLSVSLTDVYQVATFYSCFSLVPVGKHVVQVCLGTACHVRGAPRVLDRMLRDLKLGTPGTTQDMQFTVRSVRCVGCCGLAPVVRVDNNTHPNMTQAKVRGMLKKYRSKEDRPAGEADEVDDAEARVHS